MKHSIFFAALALVALISNDVYASGGYSGGGGGYSSSPRSVPRQVDQTYEIGKSIYNGRQAGAPKLSYCVMVDGEKVPVKRKSLKPYKSTSYNELADNLYDCNDPEKKIADQLGRDNFLYVAYYLNKRHKLRLRS